VTLNMRLKKLKNIVLIVCLAVLPLFSLHQLYSAYAHHGVFISYRVASWFDIRGSDWISLEAEPSAFRFMVVFHIVIVLLFSVGTILGIRSNRSMDRRLRRRAASPVDHVIRQTDSER